MDYWPTIAVASNAVPLYMAWRANAGWTLRHSLAWVFLAWAAWLWFALRPEIHSTYAAVTLTAGAGVAVLGARRPIVMAWNFIVASLLLVLWLGWAEGLLDGSGLKLGAFRLTFVAIALAVGLGNYLFTRSGLAAASMIVACALVIRQLFSNEVVDATPAIFAGFAPWIAWASAFIFESNNEWLNFRNRYGAVWALRLREQFNAAAANRGWPVELRWNGFVGSQEVGEWTEAHAALMKRFRND